MDCSVKNELKTMDSKGIKTMFLIVWSGEKWKISRQMEVVDSTDLSEGLDVG